MRWRLHWYLYQLIDLLNCFSEPLKFLICATCLGITLSRISYQITYCNMCSSNHGSATYIRRLWTPMTTHYSASFQRRMHTASRYQQDRGFSKLTGIGSYTALPSQRWTVWTLESLMRFIPWSEFLRSARTLSHQTTTVSAPPGTLLLWRVRFVPRHTSLQGI